jgi:hypothetical protein
VSEQHDGSSPCTGDLVRARVDERDGDLVEGVLHLRYIPARDYVQVRVYTSDAGFAVDPASIEVIRRGEVSIDDLEATDPVVGEPGWRRVHSLDVAMREGLILPVVRTGGSWQDLLDRLHSAVGPLLQAGWVKFDEDRDTSSEYGDSVSYLLERDDAAMQLEMYEDGVLVYYPLDEEPDDEEPSEGETIVDLSGATEDEVRAVFRGRGWLD